MEIGSVLGYPWQIYELIKRPNDVTRVVWVVGVVVDDVEKKLDLVVAQAEGLCDA